MKYLNKYELFTEASRKEIITSKDGSRFWNWNGKKVKFLTTNPKNDRVAVVMEVDEKGKPKGNKLFAKWEELKDWKSEVKKDTTEQTKERGPVQLSEEENQKIKKSLEEIKSEKPNKISLSGYFPKITALRSNLMEELFKALEPIYKQNKLDKVESSLMNLLTIETELGRLVSASNRGKGAKNVTAENPYGEDPFTRAKNKYGDLIEKKLEAVDKEIQKLKTGKTETTSTNKESEASPAGAAEEKEANPAVDKRYKELVATWKENQKKLGKNESPGEGTRARLMKQAQSEINFDETKDVEVDIKKLKKTTAYDAVDRLRSLVKGQKVKKPENVLKYLDFIKSKINSGNVAKPSLN